VVDGSVGEDRLFTELLETRNYKKYTLPVATLPTTINVQLGIMLLKIVEVVCIPHHGRLIELRFYVPLDTRTGHFGNALSSQSLGVVLKKLNLTRFQQTTQEQNGKITLKCKPKFKGNLNQWLSLRTAHIRMCVSLCTTIVHNTTQNSSDNLPCYPSDNRHCSDAVYWKEGDVTVDVL